MSTKSILKSISVLIFSATLLLPTMAIAQSFDRGYEAYLDGRYRSAKKHFTRGLRQTRDKYDKALIYKLLGLTEYMLGRNSAASSNFRKALNLDPTLTISREETRDRGAINLFNRAKREPRSRGRSYDRRPPPRRSVSSNRRSFRSERRSRRTRSRFDSRSSFSRGGDGGGGGGSSFMSVLPLGLGQFSQGKTMLGAGLAAGQAAGLLIFFERSSSADAADLEAISVIEEQESVGSYSDEDFIAYLDANEEFVLSARAEAQNGIMLFGALYALGVMEAVFNPPPRRFRSRRGGRWGESSDPNQETLLASGETLESTYIAPQEPPKNTWSFAVLPSKNGPTGLINWHLDL